MNVFFNRVSEFTSSVKSKDQDAAGKGILCVYALADCMAEEAKGVKQSVDADTCNRCCNEVESCIDDCEFAAEEKLTNTQSVATAAAPAGFDPASILVIAQVIMSILDAIRKRRQG